MPNAVNHIESLTAEISAKVWQKIPIFDTLRTRA